MKIELTKSQISYLKSLDSKKKKRKFLLDCLVENICVEETQSTKPNYSQEEIDLVAHYIEQRKLSEQGSELLKFDMFEKELKLENNSNSLTDSQIESILLWMDSYKQLRDTDITLLFKETFSRKSNQNAK